MLKVREVFIKDPQYRQSLMNIINSMEEELNTYYTDIKSITLEKLEKIFEINENEENTLLEIKEKVNNMLKDII